MNGYRGYITSRMLERSVPQHIQQMVIRDYCARNGLKFLLSSTEYHQGFLMLESLLEQDIDGIVFYSIFQLQRGMDNLIKKPIYFAAENIKAETMEDWKKIDDIFLLRSIQCVK